MAGGVASNLINNYGKAEPFRTEGGKAARRVLTETFAVLPNLAAIFFRTYHGVPGLALERGRKLRQV
ncbi:MAG: hypothetical protein QOF62_3167 [Pyrinomonadaceae bacterium]|jgi:hypothetical protein|nr:hypothetical protein [Pyrinomonadaceae bacterium]